MDLHQQLRSQIPDVEKNWKIVKELLQCHELNLDDLDVITNADPKFYYFNEVDNDFDVFKDDLYNSEISDQVIPGSDLTEDDIRRIFRAVVLDGI